MTNEYTDDETENRELVIDDVGDAFDSRRNFLKKGVAVTAAGLGLSGGTGSVAASGDETTTTSEGMEGNQQVIDVLNYATTLERLEATFYERGLEEFSEDDLVNADLIQRFGGPVQSTLYDQLTKIRDHEQAHVDALVATVEDLGGQPVGEGDVEFQFGLESPEGFIETAQTLETTGVSAYAGAAPSIENDDILAAALSIHSVEARHSAYLNGLTGQSPFPEAFDEALQPEEVLEAIQPFIVSE